MSQSHSHPEPPPIRLPKLLYRNKSSDSESINTLSTNVSKTTVSTNPTSPLHSTFCPSPREAPTDMLNPAIRSPSIVPSSTSPKTPNNPSKMKAGFFTGLFAKEPSAQALVDYQKHLLKQGQNRTCTVGLPGISSAKLPPTVPKVNSKWDGIPQTIKERDRQKHDHRISISGHSRKASSVRSTDRSTMSASHKRPGRGAAGGLSTQSHASSNRLADLYGWEGNTISSSSSSIVDFAAEHRPATARMQTSHSAPAAPVTKSTTLFPLHSTQNLPTSPGSYFELSPPSLSGSPYSAIHSHSPALTPFESSPVTPEGPTPMKVSASPLSEARLQDDIKTTMVEVPTSVDEVVIISAGVNILGPPATAKRKPKAIPGQSGLARPDALELEMQPHSILKKATPKHTPPRPTLSSCFPSPDTASPVVPQRHNSARDRLGLGMSVKNSTLAPWSSPDQSGESIEGERMVTPTPEGGQSLRKKGRMSLFHK